MIRLLRFARDAAHLGTRACAERWFQRGNRMSEFATQARRPGPTYDTRRADEYTRIALTYWKASDSMHAMADLVFGPVAATAEEHERTVRERMRRDVG